jgi:ketosteroid isomerase-like protein
MTIEAEVLAVSVAWDAALLANDATAFAGFVRDDWVYIGPMGPIAKADIVAWIATGRLAHHTMRTIGTPRVAVHGETAIVTAHKASSGAWDGAAYAADEWISEVYVRENDDWVCLLSQKCLAEA